MCVVFSAAALRPTILVAQDAAAPHVELPASIRVSTVLQPSVSALLRKSATFRQQCARIAAARHARVRIVATAGPREQLAPRARGTITRHSYGALRAVIEIPVSGDHAELIGHELEHVLEQIEDLDLPALARAGRRDIVEVHAGMFETARAKAAGLAIAYEARGGTDPIATTAAHGVSGFLRAIRARASRASHSTLLLRR